LWSYIEAFVLPIIYFVSLHITSNLYLAHVSFELIFFCRAFCNPSDVEAFTEEKKQSLLGKRHGKGADFGRAVQEIIDSFEKSKKESQIDETGLVGDVANVDISNPVISSAKDQTDTPELTHTLPKNSSDSITYKHEEVVCAAENESAGVYKDESDNKEAMLEEPADEVAAVKSPKPVTYSTRKRSMADLCLQGCVIQKHTSVRRSRNPSRAQNFVLHYNDGAKGAGDPSTTACTRRNKCVRKSPDLSGCDDFESSAFVSNGSMEDNSSEIITTDSDTFSFNEGSTIDSNFKLELSEAVECSEVELNKGLDLKIRPVVNKKKRKPNRKRATHDASKPTSRTEEEAGLQNASQSSQNICENSKERCFEQDGDEHLPLVKRARVRMGKSSVEAEHHSTLQCVENYCKEDTITNSAHQIITSSNCENGSPADGDSYVLNGVLDNVSPKLSVPCSNTQICNTKKDQTFSSVDGEAALPPSKRLHRALEAMSANAAELGQAHMEASSSTIMTASGMCCISAVKRCPSITINNQECNDFGLQKLDTFNIDSSHINVNSTNSNPMILSENKSPIQVGKQQHETSNDVLPGATTQVVEELSDHMVCQEADLKFQSNEGNCPIDTKCCDDGSIQYSPDPSILPNHEDHVRTLSHSNSASDASGQNGISLDPVMGVNENDALSPHNVNMPRNEVAVREDTECFKPAVDDIGTANDM